MEFNARKRCVTSLGVDRDSDRREWSDPRQKDGELMWPHRIGTKEVDELKLNLGPFGWAGQEQQEPLPEGGGIFKEDYFRPCSSYPVFDVCCISVDCAFTDAEQSSYVAIQGWGFKDTTPYLVKRVREHLSFVETCDRIRALRKEMVRERMSPAAVLVENKANGPAVISSLVKEIPGILPCEPRRMGGSKEARAHSVAPLASRGVMLPAGEPWVSQFLFEAMNFPKAGTDDEVDAMTQALWWRYLSNVDPKVYQRKQRFLQWANVKVTR
jgi:predicted phage terminase large subunit-like protein